jgi:RNA polymerase sigma-70 factor (ECF subfamily)
MSSPGTLDEKEILRRAKSGDGAAFSELWQRHRNEAFQIAYGYLGSVEDARDIVQEACLRALRHIHRFDLERPFFPWLYRIVRNLCFNLSAKGRRRGECPLITESEGGIDPRGSGPDPYQASLAAERAELLWEALQQLAPDHREIILLRHFRDRSYSEIAELLGIPRGTVMSRLYYARRALRRLLEDRLDESPSLTSTAREVN